METAASLDAGQRKKLRRVVDGLFDSYRYFKTEIFEEIEAKITNSYEERFHGPTGITSDPTASIAIKNVDVPEMRRLFCERVERVVNRLPIKELKVIKLCYMRAVPIGDYQMAKTLGMTGTTYAKYRDSAFLNIATMMQLNWEEEIYG